MDELLGNVIVQAIEAVPWVGVLVVVGLLFWPRLMDFLTTWTAQGQARYDALTDGLGRVEAAVTSLECLIAERLAQQVAAQSELTANVAQLIGAMRDLSDDMRSLMIKSP